VTFDLRRQLLAKPFRQHAVQVFERDAAKLGIFRVQRAKRQPDRLLRQH